MAENSKIEWCDHTFNPWVGCARVSPGCDNCYAESWAKRTGNASLWQGARRRTSAANWAKPLTWNRRAQAEQAGWAAGVELHGGDEAACIAAGYIKPRRPRVFCASLADVFDNQVPDEWRADLWDIIRTTYHLDWLLLTKRPQNIAKMLPEDWHWGLANVWLGVTAENQEEADRRIPILLSTPAAVRFVSYEPAIDGIWFGKHLVPTCSLHGALEPDGECDVCLGRGIWSLPPHFKRRKGDPVPEKLPGLGWVIVGGESGPGARPFDVAWARSTVEQCKAAGVPVLVKQLGAKPFNSRGADGIPARTIDANNVTAEDCAAVYWCMQAMRMELRDRKGGDMSEWPEDLRVREFPGGES